MHGSLARANNARVFAALFFVLAGSLCMVHSPLSLFFEGLKLNLTRRLLRTGCSRQMGVESSLSWQILDHCSRANPFTLLRPTRVFDVEPPSCGSDDTSPRKSFGPRYRLSGIERLEVSRPALLFLFLSLAFQYSFFLRPALWDPSCSRVT